MNPVTRYALSAALLIGSAMALHPAGAQRGGSAPSVKDYGLTKAEREAIAPLQAAANARNWAAAAAALPAAQAGAQSGNARYIVAKYQLQMAIETQNMQMQSQAIDALVASGAADSSELPALVQNQAALTAFSGKAERAEALYDRAVQLAPNNADLMADLAKIKNDRRKPAEAAALMDRAIAAREAAGQKPPQSWYQFGLRLAVDNKLAAPAARMGRALVGAYPSTPNWRDAALAWLETARPGEPATIDAWRLMRAAKALAGERDFQAYAELANGAGLPAEAKAVLDEGASRRMVDPAKAKFKELIAASGRQAAANRAGLARLETAANAGANGAPAMAAGEAYFSYGDYAKAAAMYRLALQKGGVDAALANTRLGAALTMAGQRVEAEAALRAATGPGSELAGLWLALLRQPA